MFSVRGAGFLLSVVLLTAGAGVADWADGLVAYWPLHGNANDVSGNGYDGVVHGVTSARSTEMDRFYRFDGNDYISASATNLPTGERTVALWFFAETVSNRPNLVGYGGGGFGTSWLMGVNHWGQAMMSVTGHYGRHTLKYWYSEPPVGDWYHYVITTSPVGTRLYVNGELKASNNDFINDTVVTDTELAIGVAVDGYGEAPYTDSNVGYFRGIIDEVRIYDRALSSYEIALLFELPPGDARSALVHVDDDALNDPGPGDATISDPVEDGSREHPFDTIQKGIDAADDGDTVIVQEGTYRETLAFRGKNIEVTSFDPAGDGMHAYPVIDADYGGTVATFDQGEDPNCRLCGFVLTRGYGTPVWDSTAGATSRPAAAIACLDASPFIGHCVIVGNRCPDPEGGVIVGVNSNVILDNCTIADNYAGVGGAGLHLAESDVTVSNSILWGNLPEEIAIESGEAPTVCCTNIRGNWPGVGNLDVEPAFAFPGTWADPNDLDIAVEFDHPNAIWLDGDYHLMSIAGRWDPVGFAWTMDELESPCIDAGDPNSSWEKEPEPNGALINLGAYGKTPQASMSANP